MMMTWALFGILEIGMVIEDPFQKALKLELFAHTIRRDLSDLLLLSDLVPEGGIAEIEQVFASSPSAAIAYNLKREEEDWS
jgi:predicted membrane chloride channel (bestrophin family)